MSEEPLVFLLYTHPDHVPRQIQHTTAPFACDDPRLLELATTSLEEIIEDDKETTPKRAKPKLQPMFLEDGPPPPEAEVTNTSSQQKLKRLYDLLSTIGTPPLFPEAAEWPTVRHRHNKRSVHAIKCLVPIAHAKTFCDWITHPRQIKDGICHYTPKNTRLELIKLGIDTPPALRRFWRATRQPSHKARMRRHAALYVYTTARTRGKNKTTEAARLDTCFQNLPVARLHIPDYGRTTAYCYEMPAADSDSFVKFIEDALSLYVHDKGVRIVARAPRAVQRLNAFLSTLDEPDAAQIRALLGPPKALSPELKWKGSAVVLRHKENRTDIPENRVENRTDIPTKPTVIRTDIQETPKPKPEIPAPVPSPRQTPDEAVVDAEVVSVQMGYGDEEWDDVEDGVGTDSDEPISTDSDGASEEENADAVSDDDVLFMVFEGSKPTMPLNQLLNQLPEKDLFKLGTVDDTSAASLQLARVDTNAVESFLAAALLLRKSGYMFAVNVEAEEWFDRLLDEYDEADIAIVRQVWARQT